MCVCSHAFIEYAADTTNVFQQFYFTHFLRESVLTQMCFNPQCVSVFLPKCSPVHGYKMHQDSEKVPKNMLNKQ